MAESAKKKAGSAKVAAVPDTTGANPALGDAPEDRHSSAACPVALCPVCAAVQLLQPLSPAVAQHLLNAGREFLLAAKAALAVLGADTKDEGDGPLEKIDIG